MKQKFKAKKEDKYTFVGLPNINIIDHVFAATNSQNRKGIGFIFASFAKKRINGVKEMITISFEVNIVRKAQRKYKMINKAN